MSKILKVFILIVYLSGLINLSAFAEENALSLTLEEALSIAIQNNIDIKLAKIDARYKATDWDKAVSVFDTIISADINYEDDQLKSASSLAGTKSLTTNYDFGVSKKFKTGTEIDFDFDNERVHSDSAFATTNPAHTSQMKVTVTQDVGKNFFGFIDRKELAVTRLAIERADLKSQGDIENSLAQAEIDYWNLVFASEVLELKKQMLEKAEDLNQAYLDRLALGTTEALNLYASEANVKMRQIALSVAENELSYAKNTLKLSLNLNHESSVESTERLKLESVRSDFIENLKEAVGARRDYQRAHKDVKVKNIEVALKENSLWPEIDLKASFAKNGVRTDGFDAINDIFGEDNPELYLGVSFSFPLENRSARSGYNKALLNKEKALLNLKKLEMEIVSELDDRVKEVNLNAERIQKWTKIVELQAAKLQQQEKRIKYGRSDADTLIRFQDDLLDAQLNLAQAFRDYRISQAKLRLAKNTFLDALLQDNLLTAQAQDLTQELQ